MSDATRTSGKASDILSLFLVALLLCLFPVLCPIMNVFLKILIIIRLCKMEGLKTFAVFLMSEATFS